jgi:hypothetical protein
MEHDMHAGRHEEACEFYTRFTALSPDQYPLVTALAAHLVPGDSDERFHFAVDVVLEGLLARAARR